MSGQVEPYLNHATEAEIAEHLLLCDTHFVPPLSSRVDVANYVRKITDRATLFEAWADGALVGLLAVYCNDNEHRVAYVTSVSVLPEWQGRGIASQLMERCIGHVNTLDFERIELEVDIENAAAITLYKKNGFTRNVWDIRKSTMHLITGRKNQ